MVKYALLIFPKFDGADKVRELRKKYDPNDFKTHITLVYALDTKYSDKQVKDIVKDVLKNTKSFNIQFKGIKKSYKKYYDGSTILYLTFKKGSRKVLNLRHKLSKKLSSAPIRTYIPHISLGYFHSKEKLAKAMDDLNKQNIDFKGVVNCITLHKVEDDKRTLIWSKDYHLRD